jgi:site-specific DNA recombinase
MGGVVPLGYDLEDRHLVVNPEEANRVKDIFQAYLAEGCVSKLQIYLEKKNIRSKKRLSKTGNTSGDNAFSRGALYSMLQNRIYLGEITHKDKSFPGQQG